MVPIIPHACMHAYDSSLCARDVRFKGTGHVPATLTRENFFFNFKFRTVGQRRGVRGSCNMSERSKLVLDNLNQSMDPWREDHQHDLRRGKYYWTLRDQKEIWEDSENNQRRRSWECRREMEFVGMAGPLKRYRLLQLFTYAWSVTIRCLETKKQQPMLTHYIFCSKKLQVFGKILVVINNN